MISLCIDRGLFLGALSTVRVMSLSVAIAVIWNAIWMWRRQRSGQTAKTVPHLLLLFQGSWATVLGSIATWTLVSGCGYRIGNGLTILYGSAYVWTIVSVLIVSHVQSAHAQKVVSAIEAIPGHAIVQAASMLDKRGDQ